MAQATPRQSIPTEPEDPADLTRQARARALRRLFVALLSLFLLLGALGLYGVRTRTRSATGGGYELSVTYASVSRPGLATPFSFQVHRVGGFPQGLTVAASSSYFDVFDENGFSPIPEEETADGDRTIWTFAPSTADIMTVSLDARIEPGVQLTRAKGRLEILPTRDGEVVVSVQFTTFVMP